ncbi:MAG: GIY-YIG nuclease family protein [Nitrososphaerota archaeon]
MISKNPGIYALIIHIKNNINVTLAKNIHYFSPGYYVYLGSAKQYGGVNSRVNRHLKKNKKLRWHIDYLTTSNSVKIKAIVYTKTIHFKECAFIKILKKDCFEIASKGFGSSDCKEKCGAHLLKPIKYKNLKQIILAIEKVFKNKNLKSKIIIF